MTPLIHPNTLHRDESILWARGLMNRKDWLILDTETTGLIDGEICQIGLLSPSGHVLMDALVKPTRPIPAEATAIHGIADEHVVMALSPEKMIFALDEISESREIVIYNCRYDKGVIENVAHLWSRSCGKPSFDFKKWDYKRRWSCAMLQYSAFVGELGRYGDYKWQKLPGGAHSAIEDCRATLGVIKEMATAALSTEGSAA